MEIYKNNVKISLSNTSFSLFENDEEIYYKELSNNQKYNFEEMKESFYLFFENKKSKNHLQDLIFMLLSENIISEQNLYANLKDFYYEVVEKAELRFFNLDNLYSSLHQITYCNYKEEAIFNFLEELINLLEYIIYLSHFKEVKGFNFLKIPKSDIKKINKSKIKVLFLESSFYYIYSSNIEDVKRFNRLSKDKFVFLYYFHKFKKRKKENSNSDISSLCYF